MHASCGVARFPAIIAHFFDSFLKASMHRTISAFSMHRTAKAFALALLVLAVDCAAQAQKADDVLAENAQVKLTRADYETDLLRIPPERRAEFAGNPNRLTMLLNSLLIDKTLAKQARDAGLERDPETMRKIALETDRLLAAAMLAKVERDAGADFDARESEFLAKAREVYAVNKAKYQTPEVVSASHILIDPKKHGDAAAAALARETREKLLAGADFAKLAAEVSDDPSAKANGGQLGWFPADKIDPAFSKAAFGLKKVGDLSDPVLSSFGWHIIRLDGRRPPQTVPFERVRKEIMAELKQRYVAEVRKERMTAISHDPALKVNQAAIDALVVKMPARQEMSPSPAPATN
jgi:peptidyl-prolyl cis-trans isomerase C